MARDKDSYVFRKGVTPNTLSVISSKNRVYSYAANNQLTQVGVIATFDPSETRTVEPVRGVGFGDQIAELVPGVTDPMTIAVTRTALYTANVQQVFGYTAGVEGIVRSLKHHRWPFDIYQEIVFSTIARFNAEGREPQGDIDSVFDPNGDQNAQALVTIYEACWMSDYSVSFASDTALVQESVTINVSDIISAAEAVYNEGKEFGNYLRSIRYGLNQLGQSTTGEATGVGA